MQTATSSIPSPRGNNGADLCNKVQETVNARAKKDGATYVVAIAHLGIDESSEPWRSTDLIANTTGIDVVLDGHSHSTIEKEMVRNKDGKEIPCPPPARSSSTSAS